MSKDKKQKNSEEPLNKKQRPFMSVQRYRDIEKGRVLPTFEEFYKLMIIFEMEENLNLKKIYPHLYKHYKRDLDIAKNNIESKKMGILSSIWQSF